MAAPSADAQEAPKPTGETQAVLDKLKELQANPVATLTVPEARMQGSAADAAKGVRRDEKILPAPKSGVATKDIAIPTQNGRVPAASTVRRAERARSRWSSIFTAAAG